MLLAYTDESYNKAFHFITALLVPGQAATSLTTALDGVVAAAWEMHSSLPMDAELHAHEMFHRKGPWAKFTVPELVKIYGLALDAIAVHDVAIIIRGVDKIGLEERYSQPDPPHGVVLTHLLERIDNYATERGEYALMIADEVDGQARYRSDLAWYRANGTWGYRAQKIARVVDTIHFAPSSASRLLQAADLVAFLHQRCQRKEKDPRAQQANEELWARITSKIHHQMCWYPVPARSVPSTDI
ncbi:DUF3800 domain-containing protein [Streptosporangium sp. NPDC006013]|uniref:DUF3800 domain-containing protein n=1 Tax=Streptosporangium sp. NPDC006013 TaxID=3155596 RepID=UPI0033A97BFC